VPPKSRRPKRTTQRLAHHQSTPAGSPEPRLRAFALGRSERTKLDPNLIMALVTVESSWQQTAVSRHGARGLGQLMPTTAAHLGVNPWDPSQNLRGASAYLRTLIDRFASRGVNGMRDAIGAYNAGHTRWKNIAAFRVLRNATLREEGTRAVAAAQRARSESVCGQRGIAAPAADERQWLANADASALRRRCRGGRAAALSFRGRRRSRSDRRSGCNG